MIRALFSRLWNGGLDPDVADAEAVRRRRTLSTTLMAFVPLLLLLALHNLYSGASQDNPGILAVVAVAAVGLFLLQHERLVDPVCHGFLMTCFAGVLVALLELGLSGYSWVWLSGLPLLATLLRGPYTGWFWTLVVIITVWALVIAHALGLPFLPTRPGNAPEHAAIDATLLILLIATVSHAFADARARTEDRLHASVARLREEVATRARAEEVARVAERAKTDFLATMSHELRTPLNGVLGAAQLLRSKGVTAEQQHYVDVISESGELLLELISNILDLTRLDRHTVNLEREAFDLRRWWDAAIAPFAIQADRKGIDLIHHFGPRLPDWVRADRTRLRQILTNLVGNAIKFTRRGGVAVTLDGSAGELQLIVRDTGIGIEPDTLESLFAPFQQADVSITRRFGGSGLGLAIVHRLVEAMGGSISVDSTPGRGSRFAVMLPIEPAQPVEVGEVEDDEQLATLKVMVVDDNAVNRMVVCRMLERLGQSVVEASDGVHAVEKLSHGLVDLILMDLSMPVMDGFRATRTIRLMPPPAREVLIHVLTAHAIEEERQRALAAGADGFLTKPLRLEDLRATIVATARVQAVRLTRSAPEDAPDAAPARGKERGDAAA